MNVTIRRAIEKDAPELMRLNTQFNGWCNITANSVALSIRNNPREQVFVAECDEQLVGFCCVQLFKSFCYDGDYAEITELYIVKQYRRKGIATRLLEYAEGCCFGGAIKGFQLRTGEQNINAQRFYEGFGYLKTDKVVYKKECPKEQAL